MTGIVLRRKWRVDRRQGCSGRMLRMSHSRRHGTDDPTGFSNRGSRWNLWSTLCIHDVICIWRVDVHFFLLFRFYVYEASK